MAKDPAFLFYPGDYLRDTQMLSEAAQVAYDRIMCEHMRNICIRQHQLNFITKRLTDDEKEALMMVLVKIEDGFQIEWVAESITKRRLYSESRRKNRQKGFKKGSSKKEKDMINISKTYDEHMENENENENVIVNKKGNANKKGSSKKEIIKPYDSEQFISAWDNWKEYKKIELGFKYKSPQSEQAALTALANMASSEEEAVKIIFQSMANGWKGFHELKNIKSNDKEANTRTAAIDAILNHYAGTNQ